MSKVLTAMQKQIRRKARQLARLQETTTVKKEYTSKYPYAVKLIEEGGIKQLHIPSNDFRQFLLDHFVSYSVIDDFDNLYGDEDDDEEKAYKDRHAKFNLSSFLTKDILKSLSEFPDGKVSNGLKEAFTTFLTVVKEEANRRAEDTARALEAGVISFENLSTAYNEGDLLLSKDNNTFVCMEVVSTQVYKTKFGFVFLVEGTVYGNNGKGFITGKHSVFVPEFKGTKPMSELGLFKLTPEVKARLIERGQRYVEITEAPYYGASSGNVVRRSWFGDREYSGVGRCMIDAAGLSTNDPNYREQFAGISPKHPHDDKQMFRKEQITDTMLMCMSPFVYGFSLVSKAWGEFKVDEISHVNFRTDAWDKLVLPQDTKDIIQALTSAENLHSVDLIDGKGGGLIFLLAGTPGIGKSSSAEGIAEKLQRPLYSVGVGELGTNVEQLETKLTRVLTMADRWKAILLLDEADIFLEARNDNDIERNAMVAVFLRMLEYYNGILFLTSNRADNLDKAFYSRISLSINYPELSNDTRERVWHNLLSVQGGTKYTLSTEEIKRLSTFELNGRQIKNVIRIGIVLASGQGRKANLSDFLKVIGIVESFRS